MQASEAPSLRRGRKRGSLEVKEGEPVKWKEQGPVELKEGGPVDEGLVKLKEEEGLPKFDEKGLLVPEDL